MPDDVNDQPESRDAAGVGKTPDAAGEGRTAADSPLAADGAPGAGGTHGTDARAAADAASDAEAPSTVGRFRAVDLLGVLLGRERSIMAAAASPWSLLVGLLLVVSGGIARHYDQADLLAQAHLPLRGVLISLVNATLLFFLASTVLRKGRWPGVRGYLAFLGVFWLTAPMAWLYGVPYERWMSERDAVDANVLTLAFVSAWRVALSARVLSLLFGMRGWSAIVATLLFSGAAWRRWGSSRRGVVVGREHGRRWA
ncbi:MAG: hypothetical protein R3B68_14395 [Phycisphaerales bacterium]